MEAAALHKNQEIEWLKNTLEMFERCQTLTSFFDCFKENIGEFPDFFHSQKNLKKTQTNFLKVLMFLNFWTC